jgi:hypothetical protein
VAPAAAPATDRPKQDDYESWDAYNDALTDWKVDQRLRAMEAQRIEREQTARDMQTRLAHYEREQAFAAQTPDYVEMMHAAAKLPCSPAMETAILASEHGPKVAYFLATHPEEAVRLSQETAGLPASAAPMVRRDLEALVSHTPPPASSGPGTGGFRPTVPPPIKPVGSAPVVADPPIEELPIDEYIEKMNARDRAARRR